MYVAMKVVYLQSPEVLDDPEHLAILRKCDLTTLNATVLYSVRSEECVPPCSPASGVCWTLVHQALG